KARQASCQSNLKQLGTALMMYAQDYDESFPCYSTWPNEAVHWYDMINPYIKAQNFTSSIFYCPSVGKKSIGGNEAAGYGVNYLLADGHNKFMRREAVMGASLDPGKEMWGHYGE